MRKTLTNQKIKNFQPKCLSKEGRNIGRSGAVSATGFVLPCCWLDRPNEPRDSKVSTLFDEKLHIDNNDTIDDIIKIFNDELIEVFKKNKLTNLIKKVETTNFHIHSNSIEDILTSDKDAIFYVCDHC